MGTRSLCVIACIVVGAIAATFALLPRPDSTGTESGSSAADSSEASRAGSSETGTSAAGSLAAGATTTEPAANAPGDATEPTPAETEAAEAAESPEDKAAKAELERGLEFRKQGRFETAIVIFRRALESSPSDEWSSEHLFQVGQTQYEIASNKLDSGASLEVAEPFFQEALATFAEVLQKYPSTKRAPSASYMSGSTYAMLDQPETALRIYETTFNQYPNYPARSRALLRAGMMLTSLDRIPEGVALFQRITREFPGRQRDVDLAKKYLHQLSIVGRRATPLHAEGWLNNVVGESGIASFEGDVVVLVFMATWCSSCSEAIPHLRRVMDTWAPRGVVFLGALDPSDPNSKEPVDAYIARSGLEFLDVALVRDQRPWAAYQTDRLPATVVIDRGGIIRWRGHPELFPSVLVRNALGQ